MQPLYRFKLDTENGRISVKRIDEYEEVISCRTPYYRYRAYSQYNYVRLSHLDKVFNNSLYSFNPDLEHAKLIIREAVIKKAGGFKAQYEKWYSVYKMIEGE